MTGTEQTIIGSAIALWFAQGWYLNTKLKDVHTKLDAVFDQFNGLREYLYEIDPQFDDERGLSAELDESLADGTTSFAGMDLNELNKNKKAQGRRTLNTPFIQALCLSIALALSAVHTHAALAASSQLAVGDGTSSCLFWTQTRDAQKKKEYPKNAPTSVTWDQWLLGYVSGAGASPPITKDPDGEAVLAWIDDYCRTSAHSLDDLAAAAHAYATIHAHP